MKKILLGSLVLLSMSSYAQGIKSSPACGQSKSFIQIKKDVSGIVDAMAPLNKKYLTSDGEVNEILEALNMKDDDYISSKIVHNIQNFESQVVNVSKLSSHYADLIVRSLKECISSEKILQDITRIEQIKASLPFYKTLGEAIVEEIALQEKNLRTISEDLKTLQVEPTQDLVIKYSYSEDAVAEDAIKSATNDLDFVQKVLSVLKELNKDAPAFDLTIVTKADNVIDQLYNALELSISSDQKGAL